MNSLHSDDRTRESVFDATLGNIAFVATVVVGLITVLATLEDALPAQVIALCLLVLLYCIIGTVVYTRVEVADRGPARAAYFGV